LYARGRPYHHPRSLARLRALLADGNADADVERALDVACGTGMSTVALADFADIVVGLDISREMMRVAPPKPNVTYMLGRADRLRVARHRSVRGPDRDDARGVRRLSAHGEPLRRGRRARHASFGDSGLAARVDRAALRRRVDARAAVPGGNHVPTASSVTRL